MAKKLDPYRETARMALEPWLVEARVKAQLDLALSPPDQRIIVKATRTPHQGQVAGVVERTSINFKILLASLQASWLRLVPCIPIADIVG